MDVFLSYDPLTKEWTVKTIPEGLAVLAVTPRRSEAAAGKAAARPAKKPAGAATKGPKKTVPLGSGEGITQKMEAANQAVNDLIGDLEAAKI